MFYPPVDSILRDLELRFGPKQRMSMNLSHLIPAAMPTVFNEDETQHFQSQTAEAERVLSKMEKTATAIRAAMEENRQLPEPVV